MIKKLIFKLLKWLVVGTLIGTLIAIPFLYFGYTKISDSLPDIAKLKDIQYQLPLTVFSKDEKLIAQFGEKKRSPILFAETPPQLINAFLAAEDDRFYEHPGVDYQGLMRAALHLLLTGKKSQGGGTITMQVVRNFLLSREKTYIRKIKEIILALKIENILSKQEIFELYLNKIYLGHRAYGVAAAAQIYYGEPLSELSVPQLAMIAGLPKAPSKYNPITNLNRAIVRRNYILKRMAKLNFISPDEMQVYIDFPDDAKLHTQRTDLNAPYIAEMVRQKLIDQYGDDAYKKGLKVYTTIDSKLQKQALLASRNALHVYDERHGYRKVEEQQEFSKLKPIGDTLPAVAETITPNVNIMARIDDTTLIEIPWRNVQWAKSYISVNKVDAELKIPGDTINLGDIIRVRQLDDKTWALTQIPKAEGALVALAADSGGILSLVGGFDFSQSSFNRALQAKRQPGSGFKPILYTTALEQGLTPASIFNDAPVVLNDRELTNEWRPENYSGKFFGPTSLRTALRKSRNLISIRLLREVGIPQVISSAQRFGLTKKQLPNSLSLALGSGSATPLQMARIFSVFANGGFLVKPYFIERITDYHGTVIFQASAEFACENCDHNSELKSNENIKLAKRIISKPINFLMNSMLRDVVRRGTAIKAMQLGRKDLAGKTGTTNDQRDAWFNGFASGIAATAWVGFDNSNPLGKKETGGKTALPMWSNFMRAALADRPEKALLPPEGIEQIAIDPATGLIARPGTKSITEYFTAETVPTEFSNTIQEFETDANQDNSVDSLF